ncbi:putative phosphoesterase [Evansella vedderi]|uniref:Phosphoesterase n=1 Tax=Evansella vedderi TaxID=38282 RepID=A0ABT9ZYX6_9BACI|nr:metallophosphoesterase family protein [Evansella vedderi]MDQ0256442.1 putative phosphoesterase [Evansella vedderi]
MKFAFISDIHGNAVALQAVLEDIEIQNVDQIIVLGDICYRGPEPKKALELTRSLQTTVIKGNADEWIVRGIRHGEVPDKAVDLMNKERDWSIEKLSEEEIDYLRSLPTEASLKLTENIEIHVFHATPKSLFDVVQQDESSAAIKEKLMGHPSAKLFIYGHIHFPYLRFFDGKVVANTGSVGLPFDGTPLASYLIVEGEGDYFNMAIRRVPYDLDKVIRQYEENNYPNMEMMTSIVRNGKLPN